MKDYSPLEAHRGFDHAPDALLVALDVEALYCSIPHDRRIQTIRSFLTELGPEMGLYNEFIFELLEFILRNNIFPPLTNFTSRFRAW